MATTRRKASRQKSVRRAKRTIGNAYFESLFSKVPEGIALCDNRGFIIKINEEFRRMFGYTQTEVQGTALDDLIAPGDPGAVALTRTAFMGESFSVEAPRRRKDGTWIHVSILGATILVHGRQVAVYGIYRDISSRKAAELALLESRTELEQANARLERLSNLDGLTAVPNRRHFEALYDTEWRRAGRDGGWISLVMIDVDFFKLYNDHHGHLAGDECLKRIALALGDGNRAGDLVARYGGEEFVALLLGSEPQGAVQAAERMRARVEDLGIAHGHSSISAVVTISLGVASCRVDEGTDPTALLAQADRALYLAKTRGRNRVETA
ncbi:MAG TPA: diguanylate cyclase [Holophaga sp.]|nr:diguanylate cyclase [Holophaga sp.]